MIKNKFLFALFLFLFPLVINAQGYRGKKFTISYQPGYSMVNPSFEFNRIMMHNKLNLGFAISKHLSINLLGSYTNSRGMATEKYSTTTMQVKDITGGISVNYFKKKTQSFAPIGRFIGLSIEFGSQNLYRTEYGPPIYPGNPPSEYTYYDNLNRGKLILYSVVFGKNYLLKEKFILGYGIQYGLCSNGGPIYRHLIKPQFNLGIIF